MAEHVVVGEQSAITTQTDFENDTVDWVHRFPANRVTTLEAPGEATVTRSEQRVRLAGTNAIASATRFPGNIELELGTSLGYDTFGNVTQVNVSGQDVAARTTQIGNFDSARYPQSITDAELNTTSVLYDHRFGTPVAVTDADQNSQLFVYDPFPLVEQPPRKGRMGLRSIKVSIAAAAPCAARSPGRTPCCESRSPRKMAAPGWRPASASI